MVAADVYCFASDIAIEVSRRSVVQTPAAWGNVLVVTSSERNTTVYLIKISETRLS